MKQAIILHGTGASPEANWFPWLTAALVARGYKVWVPQLPSSDKPDMRAYLEFFMSQKQLSFYDSSVIIGHSSGAVAALGLIGALPRTSVPKLAVLVSAFSNDLGWEALSKMFNVPLNLGVIAGSSTRKIFIHSDNDPFCPLEETKELSRRVGGELLVLPGKQHFSDEQSLEHKQIPEILTYL